MFSSIMVPEEVRRLFQVLTGEDMTDADEGVLFAVADALESGAVGVGEAGGLVGELVGKVRTEFSGKAADRFAEGLERFDGLLSSGHGALQELAVFVRELARQVRYLKLVTIYGLELLAFEMAWAMAWAGATGGASMAWLAARMAVMRLLLSRWWGQLFMRLAMAAAGGVAFNVVPDLQAQVQMLGEKSSAKWDGKLSEQAAGMGAFSALVSLPLSAVGGLVSNAVTKVLVRGLGDEVDEKILEAAAERAVDKHAELYPVSAMARFADVVGEHLDVYAGMSVRGMWAARFGSGIGEALSEGLGELFGEVGYQAATGQEVTWNPFSVTAGVFESVFSGVGNLAGLVWRGKLHPEGPSPYLDDTSQREGDSAETTDGGGFGAEKTPLLGTGAGSQTGNTPGSPGKDSAFTPSDASDASDRPGTPPPTYAEAVAGSGQEQVVAPPPLAYRSVAGGSVNGADPASDAPSVPGHEQERPGATLSASSDGVVDSEQQWPGTPPPTYADAVAGSGQEQVVKQPPPNSPVAGGDQAVPGAHGVDVSGNRPLGVHASQTPDSPAVTPDASGVPADAALPETGRSSSVVDSDGGVPAGQPSPSGMTGRDGDSPVDSAAVRGDSHRLDVAAVSPDSAIPSAEGAQAVPYPHQDPAAGVPVGVPVDAVRVPVPAEVVAGGGLAEFVRGGVADSSGGPVLLVAQGSPAAGVVVSPGQGSALAQGMGRDVVAVTPGQGGRGPQWTVFGADGSARPVTGTGAPAGNGQGVAGLADASTAVPDSGQQAVVPNETAAVQTASVASAGGRGSGEPVTDASGQTHQNPDEEFRASRQADDRTDTTGGETAEQSGETEPVAGPREAAYYNALWHGGKEPGVEDRAWQHTQARQASWFDPLPRPLKPGAWEHLRNTIPDGKADFEVGDVRMSSRPNRLVTGKGAVSYDWRRFEVAPGRGVQEFTFNAHLNSGEFLTPFRERAERELRLAEEAENAADNAAVAVRQLEQQLDSSPGNAGVLARAQADADTARQRADAQRDKAREAGVELDQRQHVLNDLKRRAADSVDELYNQGYRMAHSGDQFHFRLEFVDDPAEAHRSIGLRTDPNAGTNQVIWNPHTLGSTVAHELGHYLGLPDEYFEPGTYTLGRRQTEDGVSLPEYTVRTYLDTDVYLNPLREAVGADERWAAEAKTDAARESNDAALRDEAQRLRAKADESKQRLADAQREVDELKDRAISGVAELFRPERMHPDARYFVKLEFSDNRAESNFLVDLRQSANDDPGAGTFGAAGMASPPRSVSTWGSRRTSSGGCAGTRSVTSRSARRPITGWCSTGQIRQCPPTPLPAGRTARRTPTYPMTG
ncbi:hypothetical protein [Saccharopolyspora spinosa]|uniref:WXG100-like domain-containing protein n=1 Tax=Saccharopolyspora spinosa TaxID=60894 RepID=UPI00376F25C4